MLSVGNCRKMGLSDFLLKTLRSTMQTIVCMLQSFDAIVSKLLPLYCKDWHSSMGMGGSIVIYTLAMYLCISHFGIGMTSYFITEDMIIPKNDGARITHKLVFVGISDLGYA
ncbi:hypothetical protein R1flu_023886 [Riccia fluitans]|uniref:Uncharacterized protein n=1 Tax=Riccia fluitans TaxID=41844 RepID=A0ABD1XTS5_9MARC